ncbi:hypothetical protein L3i20_v244840 [Paenibacillus sp. L3-i20]|nr:hypothetical protein L3i20_v244840 [Paenibacillus sp. L3-i20]
MEALDLLFLIKLNYDEKCCPLMASSILGEMAYEASACVEKPTTVLFIPVHIFQKWMNT